MPIYEFRCEDCGEHAEVWLRSTTDTAMCPQCGASLREKLLSAPFVMSRETRRPAGQTCCGRDDCCAAPACSTDGACRRE